MKKRQGFVSNSSSSSFVIVMSIERYEDSVKDYSKEERKAIDSMANKISFMGHGLVTFKDMSDREGTTYSYLALGNEPEEMKELVSAYMYEMEESAKEDDFIFVEQINM